MPKEHTEPSEWSSNGKALGNLIRSREQKELLCVLCLCRDAPNIVVDNYDLEFVSKTNISSEHLQLKLQWRRYKVLMESKDDYRLMTALLLLLLLSAIARCPNICAKQLSCVTADRSSRAAARSSTAAHVLQGHEKAFPKTAIRDFWHSPGAQAHTHTH